MQELNAFLCPAVDASASEVESPIDQHSLPEHLAQVPGTPWAFWRWICLRSAGFPSDWILKLASPGAALAADRLLELEEAAEERRIEAVAGLREQLSCVRDEERRLPLLRALKRIEKADGKPPAMDAGGDELQRYAQAHWNAHLAREKFHGEFQSGIERASTQIAAIAGNPKFREAVLLQNRRAMQSGIDVLLRHRQEGKGRGKKERQQEELVASYLQRYCVKNDSIGFFGPVGWARFVRKETGFLVRPGDPLVLKSGIFFENWCIEELASKIGADRSLHSWIAPRILPFCNLEGNKLSCMRKTTVLSAVQTAVLEKCDGSRLAKEIAAELTAGSSSRINSEEQVYRVLRLFEIRRIISWKYEIPVCLMPEEYLRGLLNRIDNEELRRVATESLDALVQAKVEVEAALGNPEALEQALEEMDATFAQLTGASATRSAGAMYAGRTLTYLDCRRNLDVEIAADVQEALGRPLSLLLASARWFSHQAGAAARDKMRQLYEEALRKNGGQAVELLQLWAQSEKYWFTSEERPFHAITRELQARWQRILEIPAGQSRIEYKSQDLSSKVEKLFSVPRPGWDLARYNSPDVMIAATSVEAIHRGDYLLVLGEMHATNNTIRYSFALAQHPEPGQLFEAITRDLSSMAVLPVPPRYWPRTTNRTSIALVPPETRYLEITEDPISNAPRSKALPIASLLVCDSGEGLVVRTRDGKLTFDLIDFAGEILSNVSIDLVKIVSAGRHVPRITVDKLVIARESWSFLAEELPFIHEQHERQRYLEARRWMRRNGLPRFVFVKAPTEVKPIYVDFESPVYVELMAKVARRLSASHRPEALTVSEMLPAPDQLWLPDAQGSVYTSELRIVVRDLALA